MVNLKANPYYLSDEDIAWVKNTIASMTDEEKVGQLFFQLTMGIQEDYLKELMDKYHLEAVAIDERIAQKYRLGNRKNGKKQ